METQLPKVMIDTPMPTVKAPKLSESALIGLLACPFCGEKRINHMRGDVGNLHWGFCTCCRAEGPVAMSWSEAKELWNTRSENPGCKDWDEEEQECAG